MLDQKDIKDAKRDCLESLQPYLDQVEEAIRSQASSFDPAVEGYISYLLDTGGKRIRPMLALLSGGAVAGTPSNDHIQLGLILELIHIATLVHDDIMDGATLRRQMPTASAKWGNALSVLLGDCLFAHALELSTEFKDTEVCRKIARASNEVCMGEIIQTQRRFDLGLSKSDYFRIIEMKTAALFAAAMELAARLSNADEALQAQLYRFGMKLGTSYQIYDDSVDLLGSEADTGKTLGTDLEKGKLTLPVIHLMENATDAQRAKLNSLILRKEPLNRSVLAGIADYEGAIERSLLTATRLLDDARQELVGLPENLYTGGLKELLDYVAGLVNQCRASSY